MMQQWIAYLIVAYAAWLAAKRYAPASLRRGANAWLRAGFVRLGWNRMAGRFVAGPGAAASCGGGCSSCDSCGSNAAAKHATVTPEALRRTIRR